MYIDNDIYKDGWNNKNAYVYGIIMSDGCLKWEGRNKTKLAIRIGLNDCDMIKALHDYMCIGNKIYCQGKQYSLKFRNESSINFLIKNGLTERKSLTMKFPKLPLNVLPSFIRGYFDGDGSIVLSHTKHNTYGQVTFTSGSIEFLISLQDVLMNEFDIKSKIYDDGHPNTHSRVLKITKRSETDKFFQLIYKNADIYLDRKYKKFEELNSSPLKNKVA